MFFFISFFTSFSFTWFEIFFVIVNFQVFVFCFISLKSIGFQVFMDFYGFLGRHYLDRLVCISRSSGWANPWLRSVWIIFPNRSLPSCHHHGRAPMSDALLLSCSKSKNHKYWKMNSESVYFLLHKQNQKIRKQVEIKSKKNRKFGLGMDLNINGKAERHLVKIVIGTILRNFYGF